MFIVIYLYLFYPSVEFIDPTANLCPIFIFPDLFHCQKVMFWKCVYITWYAKWLVESSVFVAPLYCLSTVGYKNIHQSRLCWINGCQAVGLTSFFHLLDGKPGGKAKGALIYPLHTFYIRSQGKQNSHVKEFSLPPKKGKKNKEENLSHLPKWLFLWTHETDDQSLGALSESKKPRYRLVICSRRHLGTNMCFKELGVSCNNFCLKFFSNGFIDIGVREESYVSSIFPSTEIEDLEF